MPTERFIAVGDIHGCPDQLEEILVQGRAWPDHRWVFLGDYLDRGPDAEAVISRLRDLDAVFLLGNHEQMLLDRCRQVSSPALVAGWLKTARISASSLLWLSQVPLDHWETEDYFFVHGGLDVKKPLDRQTEDDYLWVRHDGDYRSLTPKWVVHGHHSIPEPRIEGNRVNINTGCGAGGPLTALVLPEFRFLQSSPSVRPRMALSPEEVSAYLDATLPELGG